MKLFYSIGILTFVLMFSACDDNNHNQMKKQEPVVKIDTIIKAMDLINKKLKDVELLLGKAESMENISGYPCENTKCFEAIFENGKYEILFQEKLSVQIKIRKIKNLKLDRNAIISLGLPISSPSFFRENTVIKWSYNYGFKTIQFNSDGNGNVSWIFLSVI